MQLSVDKLGKVAITVEENYWSIEKDYDKLTIVEKEGVFGTFISRKPVPAGTVLTDRKYWIPFSSLKEEIVLQFNEKEAEIYKAIDSFVDKVNKAVNSIKPIEITGDVANAPDEEDLTSINVGGIDVLKFKDKVYSPLTYSGMGRKILRKNIVDGVNILTQSMINQPNIIYIIQYDFTLGENIEIPANCVLEFDGGSISGNNNILRASENCVLDMGGTLPTGIKIFSDNKTTRIKNPPHIDFFVNDEIFWGRFWNMNWQELTFKMEPIHRPFKLTSQIPLRAVSEMKNNIGCLRHCGITEYTIHFDIEWNTSNHTYSMPTEAMERALVHKNVYNLEPYYFRIQNNIRNDNSLKTSYNIMKSESEIYIPLYVSLAKEIVDYIKEHFPNTKYIIFDNESKAIYRNENWMNGYKELYSYAESKGFIGGIDDNTAMFYNAHQRASIYGGGIPDYINSENIPLFGINIYPTAYSTDGNLKVLSSTYHVEDITKEQWEKVIQERIYYIIEKRGFDNVYITESGFSPSWYNSFDNVDGFNINDNKWDIVCAGQIEGLKIWRDILKRYSAVISFWNIWGIGLHWYSKYDDKFTKNINKSIYNLFINF